MRSASTDHSSSQLAAQRVGRVLVDLDRPGGAKRPAAGPRRQPAAPGARPATSRRRSARRTAPTCSERRRLRAGAAPSARAGAQGARRSSSASKLTSRPARPSWLGEPRRRSSSSAASAASTSSAEGSKGSGRQRASTCPGFQGPRASKPGVLSTAYTVASAVGWAAVPRRLKYWGWGYEDEQPSEAELRATANLIRQHLGFGAEVPAQPVPLSAVTLPEPRVSPPASLAPICFSDPYERALHAYGRSYMDVLRAFRGRFDHAARCRRPPARRDRASGDTRLGHPGRRGRDPLRWRHQRGRRRRAAGRGALQRRGDDRPQGTRPRARGRSDLARGADPGRRDRTGLEEQLARARVHAAPLPAVLPVLDPGRLDRHPRRRPLCHPLHPHRRPGRVDSRGHARRRLGVASAARIGRRGFARPDADRLRGNARRDHRGVGPGPPEAPHRASAGVQFDDFMAVPRPSGRSLSRASIRPTAA